jgi:hypothetical protein
MAGAPLSSLLLDGAMATLSMMGGFWMELQYTICVVWPTTQIHGQGYFYKLVYELLLLSYCYIFMSCLMKCVSKSDLD